MVIAAATADRVLVVAVRTGTVCIVAAGRLEFFTAGLALLPGGEVDSPDARGAGFPVAGRRGSYALCALHPPGLHLDVGGRLVPATAQRVQLLLLHEGLDVG
eukprot:3568216-Prymnesium_polylepis.1